MLLIVFVFLDFFDVATNCLLSLIAVKRLIFVWRSSFPEAVSVRVVVVVLALSNVAVTLRCTGNDHICAKYRKSVPVKLCPRALRTVKFCEPGCPVRFQGFFSNCFCMRQAEVPPCVANGTGVLYSNLLLFATSGMTDLKLSWILHILYVALPFTVEQGYIDNGKYDH